MRCANFKRMSTSADWSSMFWNALLAYSIGEASTSNAFPCEKDAVQQQLKLWVVMHEGLTMLSIGLRLKCPCRMISCETKRASITCVCSSNFMSVMWLSTCFLLFVQNLLAHHCHPCYIAKPKAWPRPPMHSPEKRMRFNSTLHCEWSCMKIWYFPVRWKSFAFRV